jgi:hypothetical protein
VHQLWEQSQDAGVTWTVAFDGTYVPRPAEADLSSRSQATAI